MEVDESLVDKVGDSGARCELASLSEINRLENATSYCERLNQQVVDILVWEELTWGYASKSSLTLNT